MTPLDNDEKIKHIADYGDSCPCCGSNDVRTSDSNRAFGTISMERWCPSCKAEWTDTYELTDVSLTKESAA